MKNCTCSTNAVIFKPDQEFSMVCLKCKTPYNIKPTDSISISMPIKIQKDGHVAEVVFNSKQS